MLNILAFSLLEFLFVTALVTIITCSGFSICKKLLFVQHAHIHLNQIQTCLNLARSLAIKYRQNVKVCPSYNGISCVGSWQGNILVKVAKSGELYSFKVPSASNITITLQQSGFSQQSVTVQPNGLTYSNGHFTYISTKDRYLPSYNLYFNRAVKTYIQERHDITP
jgi:Tfp pilus assembly protein FimT